MSVGEITSASDQCATIGLGCQSFSFLVLFLVLSPRTRNDYENEERGEPVGSCGLPAQGGLQPLGHAGNFLY
jgi:hypothetical protein